MRRPWLPAGDVAADQGSPTATGTPHGGLISPALANRTRAGLERVFAPHVASTTPLPPRTQVHLGRDAADCISTGRTPARLATAVNPVVEPGLRERG
jgi:RNA-directed DNA polymerase